MKSHNNFTRLMSNKFKLFLISFLILGGQSLLSQTKTISVQTNWDAKTGACDICDFNRLTKEIHASQTLNLNVRSGSNFTYEITDIEYDNTIFQTVFESPIFSSSPEINVQFRKSRGQWMAVTTFKPMVSVNGTGKKIKRFKIVATYNSGSNANIDREHTFASESVLRKGKWYKIGIPKSGVYKLTKTDLDNLGVSTASLNPKHINIYANHTPQLPINNNVYRPDDLLKNSIAIIGESDNSFDQNDYILFYGTGPDVETPESDEGFNVSRNDFDTLAYAYLCVDATEAPKRINSMAFPSTPANTTSNSFNEVVLHENDFVNLIKSGSQWYGENFDIYQEQEIAVNTPNAIQSVPAKIFSSAAIYSIDGSSSINILVNGITASTLIGKKSVGAYTKAIFNTNSGTFTIPGNTTTFNVNFNQGGNPASQAWLDVIQVNYRRQITNSSEQIRVRDWEVVGSGNLTEFSISSPTSSVKVWDVTSPSEATELGTSSNGSTKRFKSETDTLKTFTVFDANQAYTPELIGSISNQNLHALSQVDYLIVSPEIFLDQANRLADLHRGNGLSVHVVELQSIYNEFSCGVADPGSIKLMARMFYDRASGNPNSAIESLLLFGDGSYDLLNRIKEDQTTNLIPTYQNAHSTSDDAVINFINSYTSDDFFGLLDDDEGMDRFDLLDIGVGRLPVHTELEARAAVDKIEHYMNYGSTLYANTAGVKCDEDGFASSLGDWRMRNLLIADDEDGGKFVQDCENLSDTMDAKYPEMNSVKLYLDAFQQEATSSGQRYPEVENAINQIINTGALVSNYVGHGGETGLSAERILSVPTIKTWNNVNNLTLFVSATCEFTRFDDPDRVSAGEFMFLQPYGGSIGLLTTTRLVLIFTNSKLVKNLYSVFFKEEGGKPLNFGEIIRRSKNLTSGDENMRNFTLIGDPALVLGKPQPSIKTTHINGTPIAAFTDTIKALSKVTIEGEVTNANGELLTNFNGFATPVVFDKTTTKQTLGQDAESPIIPFSDRTSQLYKGKSTVTNGKFKFTFIVPKDINYAFGSGKLSYYAENSQSQKFGFDTSIVIGGVDPNGVVDNLGPDVNLFMNDESFVDGGITDENPIFIARVSDENGINTTGNGIGHDISLILDGQTSQPIILNNFYQSDLDTYQSGKAEYQILDLEPGKHTATFKVWDVNNNSSERTLNFEVKPKEDIAIQQLLNYPNPFTTRTSFFFEHNQVCNQIDTKIEILRYLENWLKQLLRT